MSRRTKNQEEEDPDLKSQETSLILSHQESYIQTKLEYEEQLKSDREMKEALAEERLQRDKENQEILEHYQSILDKDS